MADPRTSVAIESICRIYFDQVLPQKTREVELLGRICEPQIVRSFLGFEIKLQRKRITCPDMVTARYLRIFAEVGMRRVLIPYNPVHTAAILSGLESAFQMLRDSLQEGACDPEELGRRRQQTYRRVRKSLKSARPPGKPGQ